MLHGKYIETKFFFLLGMGAKNLQNFLIGQIYVKASQKNTRLTHFWPMLPFFIH